MAGRNKIGEKISEELGIPKTVVSGFNHIELFGNREATVNDCEGILEYSDERIKLNMGKNTILFSGNDLCMKEYGAAQAKITGTIAVIEFG
ncbi:MAG: YabP/YqfC family sporulation protein [Clostridia bacterium]|nr:YabP/YqfC family sporulation protein [Clostridia bacterium]